MCRRASQNVAKECNRHNLRLATFLTCGIDLEGQVALASQVACLVPAAHMHRRTTMRQQMGSADASKALGDSQTDAGMRKLLRTMQ
jgi:hypothetical protein